MAERPTTDAFEPDDPDLDARSDESAKAPAGDEPLDVAQLQQQRDEYREWLLRKTAEFDNYRKRVDRERRDLESFAISELLQELLPLVDDFERALKVDAGDGRSAYRAGIELIYKQLLDILRKHGVTPIDTVGKTFDPHFHQSVAHEASPNHRDGEIVAELRRGYMLGDRLLRAAMVKVAKA